MSVHLDRAEWLEADGLGGFASGPVLGPRNRRYHALLLAATTPPTGRVVLVNGFDAFVETTTGHHALTSQRYAPNVIAPDGQANVEGYSADPWPRWIYRLDDGTRLEMDLFVPHGVASIAMRWRILEARGSVRLSVRPFLSGRDYHALHRENGSFRFDVETAGERRTWRPYSGVPAIVSRSNMTYRHEPRWYRNFVYAEETARGLDDCEDLASPGEYRWDLTRGEAVWLLSADNGLPDRSALELFRALGANEVTRRGCFPSPLDRAADAYIVRRGPGQTIVAGYPWFTDWGRDTFIALRGLCLAGGRLDTARDILLAWAATVSEGMLPNRFPDRGVVPEYNSVDASLWFIIAAYEYLQCGPVLDQVRSHLYLAILLILEGYFRGTRYGIRADTDCLLAAGQPGVALTWMDAKCGEWVVTPRIGKPVEVQALWLNALAIGSQLDTNWKVVFDRGLASFRTRFWNDAEGCLYDLVDVDHRPGTVDASFRPNQLFAIGGLPLNLLDLARGWRIVQAVEDRLWTPLGPRSLAPGERGYQGRYRGGVRERDGAYHQGTVWPWLTGPFVEAWVRVRGGSSTIQEQARERFLVPFARHLHDAGIGHISEVADGDEPHTPGGCPFQAWSLGELLRLDRIVLAGA